MYLGNQWEGGTILDKRVVIKLGSASLGNMQIVAAQIADAKKNGWKPVVVSSGAIAYGKKIHIGNSLSDQAYSAIGQHHLMAEWEEKFSVYGLMVGMILFVNHHLTGRSGYSTTKGLVHIMDEGIIPIINENDAISTFEIRQLAGFGDNDQLAALVAIAIKADHLILLTTVDGVICPESNLVIPRIDCREKRIARLLSNWPDESKGGMISKLRSAKRAAKKGVLVNIANSAHTSVITDILSGTSVGTEVPALIKTA